MGLLARTVRRLALVGDPPRCLIAERHPAPRDTSEVGRQAIEGAAILDIANWLAVNGFAGMSAGERQKCAYRLRRARISYERIAERAL